MLFLVLVLSMVLSTGCTASNPNARPDNLPQAKMPAGATFTGTWYSTPEILGRVYLTQQGEDVVGTYEHRSGQICGKVVGGVLFFDWQEPGDGARARKARRGRGFFVMKPDGRTFEGEWGLDDEWRGGGPWSAEKVSDRDRPEPR